MAVDDQIGDEDEDQLNQEQRKNAQDISENQMSDVDDETELDHEEYEMEVGGKESREENKGQIVQIEEEYGDAEKELEDIEDSDAEESLTVEDARIVSTLPHRNGQTRKMARQSVRHLKRKQTDKVNKREGTEDDDDEGDQVDDESSRPANRTRINSTQLNNVIGEKIGNESDTKPFQTNLSQTNLQFQCPQCQKSFVSKSKLQTHLRVHTGERPFKCDLCDKRFNQLGNLERHQLIHQNIKRFECDQCHKLFSVKTNLTQHQLVHQNVKSFQCAQCKRQFTQKQQLDSHLLTHSGKRPFKCRHCDKSFSQLNTRNTHEQAIHLHVKPYRCKQCGHTGTGLSNVIKHIRIVHFGLPSTIKQQRALNIVDHRDARKLVETV